MVGAIQSGSSLSADMLAQMRERMFARLDTDGDGQIGAEELAAASQSNSQDRIPADLVDCLNEADIDGNGAISKEEFDSMTFPEPPGTPPMGFDQTMIAKLREQMFSDLDTNGDGQIDADEIAAITSKTGDSDGKAANLAERILALDSDGDGVISREEFESMTPPERPPMNVAMNAGYRPESLNTQVIGDFASSLDIMI
jgi:Ca2+-binding EF-hand superfamily protein